ncbi:IS66 family insertion sequence element accessory protein TnpB [Myroides odoratimimus]|uniref:IS66 family insertion sequence element accessory protein TnpA n=1 Tax=Myroides odoratimimus TaxID=76832 RepID=UPI00257917EA|nr:IS66 family insertion sequence element accessory protein TnpB [Myroides odoratimimus]MDM1506877.1 IS66 family insertion sequence element accessory protein TnpB [Myroides odoratimimus]MDM1537771.1 IS66 family insertion sequence element accessory protein TnpB [Myroides odoratimimus]MDM1677324.1 IS66 family insertion sequence element accessory protein TnpB [Myroides odoratimimus]
MSKQEIMYSYVEDWQASGLTQSKYCESVGINLATFSYWVVKYKNKTVEERSSSFIAIGKTSKTEGKVSARASAYFII